MLHFKQLENAGLTFAGVIRKADFIDFSNEEQNIEIMLTILKEEKIIPRFIYRVKQEHSDYIYIINQGEDIRPVFADGIITRIPGIAICISVADCVPVFLFDRQQKILGLIHAGREGTRKCIAQKAIKKFVDRFNSNVCEIVALIGPSIGPCCYRLPDSLLNDCFRDGLFITEDKTLDLWKSNEKQLLESGIKKENIFVIGECTCCEDEYYSYRKGDKKNRNFAIGII